MDQKNLPFPPVLVRKPKRTDMALIKMCSTAHEALKLQVNLSGLTHEFIGNQLGIDKGQFSRIMSNTAHFPLNKIGPLNYLTGNYALQQFLDWDMRLDTSPYIPTPEEKIAELEAQLAQMKARAR